MTVQEKRKEQIRQLTMGAILTSLVILLQFMGSFIRFGVFSVSLVLVPIVIGAATCSVGIAAWLGFVFAIVVLLSGDAAPFMSINLFGTIVTVIAKGVACGAVAGLVYKALQKFNSFWAVMAAAAVCPIVNTGIFLIGCAVFFLEGITPWAADAGQDIVSYLFFGLAGLNFVFELITNLALGPAVTTVLKVVRKNK